MTTDDLLNMRVTTSLPPRVSPEEQEELQYMCERLYSLVEQRASRFNDWEYQFIKDMYEREDKSNLSVKQVESIRRLDDKFQF